jgi:hypothetical protein
VTNPSVQPSKGSKGSHKPHDDLDLDDMIEDGLSQEDGYSEEHIPTPTVTCNGDSN